MHFYHISELEYVSNRIEMGFANVTSPCQIFLHPLLLFVDETIRKKYFRSEWRQKLQGGITEYNIPGI